MSNAAVVLSFSFSGLRTPWMVKSIVLNQIRKWNGFRVEGGGDRVEGILSLFIEVPTAKRQEEAEATVSVKFTVAQNGHDAGYYAEALRDLGYMFKSHYRLEKEPFVGGIPN